ncbi:MAG TPA: alpha/beta hydrolase [Nodosilinea sp.]|nr:alpha/beta hydrolase [Nodosilinea sp.]
MPTASVFGVPHYYRLTPGEGASAVVFIHGWLLSHRYWQPVIDQVAPSYPCLAYDLRGFGESRHGLGEFKPGIPAAAEALGATQSSYGLGAYARDLAALVGQLGLGPVWLVGHSLGGSVALWMAYCFPELVKGVVCLNAGGGIYLEKEFQKFRQAGQAIVRWRQPWLGKLPLLPLVLTRMMVCQPLAYQWGRDRSRDLLCADPEAALGTLLESTTEAEVHLLPRLVSALTQPVFFVAGRQDQVMNIRYVNHLAGYLAASRNGQTTVLELENCGHLAMLEQPEQVANLLKDLLATAETGEDEPYREAVVKKAGG